MSPADARVHVQVRIHPIAKLVAQVTAIPCGLVAGFCDELGKPVPAWVDERLRKAQLLALRWIQVRLAGGAWEWARDEEGRE